jgi:hypothetical protein
MADINLRPEPSRSTDAPANASAAQEPVWDIIELIFFAYRDFVSDPDDVLAAFGFGRAHHRVLHFVNRNPGLKVAELLEILNHQTIAGRVLKRWSTKAIEQRRAPIADSACCS